MSLRQSSSSSCSSISEGGDYLQFANLPELIIQQICDSLEWTDLLSLSLCNFRLQSIVSKYCNRARYLSIKGNEMIEYYLINVSIDDGNSIYYQYSKHGAIIEKRTLLKLNHKYSEKFERLSSFPNSTAFQHAFNCFKNFILTKRFDAIHIGQDSFVSALIFYNKGLNELVLPNISESIKVAERLQPTKLSIYPQTGYGRKKQADGTSCLRLEKLPRLRTLCIFAGCVNIDDVIRSKNITSFYQRGQGKIRMDQYDINSIVHDWRIGNREWKRLQLVVPVEQQNSKFILNHSLDDFAHYYSCDCNCTNIIDSLKPIIVERFENSFRGDRTTLKLQKAEIYKYNGHFTFRVF